MIDPPGRRRARPSPRLDGTSACPRPAVSGELAGAALRCFDGTSPTIVQPALDENIVAIHLKGDKRVNRWQGRTHQTWDVPCHAVTLMPAFRANRWHTEGVIAYAHLSLSGGLMARLARDELGRDADELLLLDKVGIVDPLLSELMLAWDGRSPSQDCAACTATAWSPRWGSPCCGGIRR